MEIVSAFCQYFNPDPKRRRGLWLSYARLHVLETHSGNASLAGTHLLQARYWYLKKLELSGESTDVALESVTAFTATQCKEIVRRFDEKNSNGRGAAYLR